MKKKTLTALAALGILVLLLVVLFLVAGRTSLLLRPLEIVQEAAPTPEPTAHVHLYDAQTHLCTGCGEPCPHENGFDDSDRCRDCLWLCPHETHSAETAACPVCGKQFNHHFGMDGVCDVCGAEAALYTVELPDRYFSPAAHSGRCLRDSLTLPDGLTLELAVYLPWDYNEQTRYNVAILCSTATAEAATTGPTRRSTPTAAISSFIPSTTTSSRSTCAIPLSSSASTTASSKAAFTARG